MPQASNSRPRSRAVKWLPGLAVLLIVGAGVAWLLGAFGSRDDDPGGSGGSVAVTRGDLVITVTEGGNLRAKESKEIVNKVEGTSTILELVPEGTYVKKGDVLVKLDAADLQEKLVPEEARLKTQEADYLAAEEALAIQLSEHESELKKAKLAERFAEIDFHKYRDGDWPQQKKQAAADITVAEQELARAKDRLIWTKKLEAEGIVTRQDLEADKLAVIKAEIDFEQAKAALKLLEEYDNPKQMAKLKSDWEEAVAEGERVKRRQKSEVAQKKADRDAKKANYEIQMARVAKLREQIEHTIIKAPQSGMIVYWTPRNRWSSQKPPEVGGTVRHRQTIMTLPDVSRMEIDVKIHESQIDRVRAGQPVRIKVDAFPDRDYTGTVTPEIAIMADSQRWFNPDVKVYNVVISIDQETDGLKPGMSAKVEIICEVIRNKLLAPVTAVHILRGQTAAIVRNGSGLEIRRVKVGPTNDKQVVIEEGLEEGDMVMLYEPEVMPEIPWEEPKEKAPDLPPIPEVIPADKRPAAASGAEAKPAAGQGGKSSGGHRGGRSGGDRS